MTDTVAETVAPPSAQSKRALLAEFTYKDAPLFAEARAISKFARDLFLKGTVDQVDSATPPRP